MENDTFQLRCFREDFTDQRIFYVERVKSSNHSTRGGGGVTIAFTQ